MFERKQRDEVETVAILHRRAEKFALKPQEELKKEKTLEVVEFKLAHESYALESTYIREVYPFKEVTWIPCVPSFVLGLINVRRRILSVIDLRVLFELPIQETNTYSKVLIIEKEGTEFAILAESILGVRFVPLGSLQNTIPTLKGIREEFLRGLTPEGLIILNGDKLLTDKKIIVRETVGEIYETAIS